MASIEKATHPIRERVVLFLAFLTSEACWAACRQYMTHEALSAELTRLWFDELYVPGTSYLHGLKGDQSADAIAQFEACFTPDERATLERFHGCFELRLDMAINRVQGRARFPDNDSWRSIIRDAAHLLADLEPNAERLQTLLAAMIERITNRANILPPP